MLDIAFTTSLPSESPPEQPLIEYSSERRDCLTVGRAKVVPSFLSYFKTHRRPPALQSSALPSAELTYTSSLQINVKWFNLQVWGNVNAMINILFCSRMWKLFLQIHIYSGETRDSEWQRPQTTWCSFSMTVVVYHLENVNGTCFFGPFQRKITETNGTSEKVVMFPWSEYSKRKFLFYFFKATFDTNFRLSKPFSVNGNDLWILLTIYPNLELTGLPM